MIGGDTDRRQPEAGRGDAGHVLMVRPILRLAARAGAVQHQAGARICVFSEVSIGTP